MSESDHGESRREQILSAALSITDDLAHRSEPPGSAIKRPNAPPAKRSLFDHLIGEREQIRRDGHSDSLGGREIDDEFEFCRLLGRNIPTQLLLTLWLRFAGQLCLTQGIERLVIDMAARVDAVGNLALSDGLLCLRSHDPINFIDFATPAGSGEGGLASKSAWADLVA